MTRTPMQRFALGCCAVLLVAASGCTQVLETTPLQPDGFYGPTCRSTLGAYYLPRALISLHVKAGDAMSMSGLELPLIMAADRTQPLCLDYLSLPTARDIIVIQRDPNGLLKSISSDLTDRTPEIAKALIATGENLAIAAARSAALDPAQKDDSLDVDFDPFDWTELVAVKKALRRFGFCLYIEGHTVPAIVGDPALALAAGRDWCAANVPVRTVDPLLEALATLPVPVQAMGAGVLYRPNMTHKLVIMRKGDPGGREPWKLFQTKRIEVPNVSPVLSIGVERALFANRKTSLTFNQGVLTDVAIDKGSELVGFVQIPLALAKAIVDVPGQIITFRITDAQNQTALLNAQTQLIETTAKYRELVGAPPAAAAGAAIGDIIPRSADVRSARFLGACTDAGGKLDVCKILDQGARR